MADRYVAVLDIRSSEIAVFYGVRGINHTFVFKASATEAYDGYQDGAFYDVEALTAAVRRAVNSVEQVCGEKLRSLYIGVPGEFTRVEPKEQELSFSKKRRIGSKEISTLFENGKESLDGYRLIRVAAMIYETADKRRVVNPEGLYSTGLSGILSYFYCSEYFAETMETIFEGTKLQLHFLPTQFAMATYLIPAETRDEYALFLDVGFLSSTICVVLGGGILVQRTFWAGEGQIVARLMQAFRLPYDVAAALLARSNLFIKKETGNKEFTYGGMVYTIPVKRFIEEVKAGLDDLCEEVGAFLEECSGKELDYKPLYVSGEGLNGIRGALEHMSKRLSCMCEQLSPDLPYYNKPAMSSRIALVDMAYEDDRKGGSLYRFFKLLGG